MTDSTTYEPEAEALDPVEQGQGPETEVETDPSETEGQELDATAEGAQPEGDNDADFEDFEQDGQTFKVHKALKPALLRQQDYTQKTQALAQSRQSFEAEAQTRLQQLQQREQAIQGVEDAAKTITVERIQLEKAKDTIAEFDQAISQAYSGQDYQQAQQLQWQRDQWRNHMEQLQGKVAESEQHLAAKRQELSAQVEESHKAAIAAGIRTLESDPVVKLSKDVFDGVVAAAATHGFTQQEVYQQALADPRMFKFLKIGTDALAENAKLKAELAARKGTPPASAKPATKVSGSNGASTRKTTDASGDGLSAEEWARREMARTASLKKAEPGRRHPLVT